MAAATIHTGKQFRLVLSAQSPAYGLLSLSTTLGAKQCNGMCPQPHAYVVTVLPH
jgi:hypothetical protein